MRSYEFTVIVRPDLAEEELMAVLTQYEEKIATDGRVVRKDVWGTKRFAYPVKKFFRGYYVCYSITVSPTVIKDLEHQIRFDNRVLRHMVISVEDLEERARLEEIDTPEAELVDNDTAVRSTEVDSEDSPVTDELVTEGESAVVDTQS